MENDYKITLTKRALIAIEKQLEKRKTPQASLRLGVKGGSCSGFKYHIAFEDDPPKEKDFVYEFGNTLVIIDPKSMVYLNGCTLDWKSSLKESGFDFINPNTTSKCGCGKSFSMKENK